MGEGKGNDVIIYANIYETTTMFHVCNWTTINNDHVSVCSVIKRGLWLLPNIKS